MISVELTRLRSGLARRELVFDQVQLTDQEVPDIVFDGLKATPPQMLMMRGADFSGATLRNWKLSVGNMLGSNFQETKFDNCAFMSTQFQGSDFFGASFTNCNFASCYMFESFYSNARFVNCNFMQTSMRDSVMSNVNFINTSIEWLKLDGVQDATRRATARVGKQALAAMEDSGLMRNHIDQASLDRTLTMLSARRRADPKMQRNSLFGGKSLSAEAAKHFNGPADIEKFLRTTTLSPDQIRRYVARFKSA